MEHYAILNRNYKDNCTLGVLTLYNKKNEVIFECDTLELPYLNNKVNVSCIKEGSYVVESDDYGRHKYFKLLDVEGRSGIEIHIANTVKDLQGCIGLGKRRGDYLIKSRITCDKLKSLVKCFILYIDSIS